MQDHSASQRLQLIELYIGYFNRAPEQAGLDYWSAYLSDALARGQSASAALADIANQFYQAGLQFGLFRADDDTTTLIRAVYRNVLGRDQVDPAGLDYWRQRLDSKELSRGEFVLNLIQGAKDYIASAPANDPYRWVGDYLEHRKAIGDYFAATSGDLSGTQAITQGRQIIELAASRDALQAGQTLLDTLTHAVRLQQPNALQVSATNPGTEPIVPRTATAITWLDARDPDREYEWRGPAVTVSFPDTIPPEHAQDTFSYGWAPVPVAWRGTWFDTVAKALAPVGLQPVRASNDGDIRIVLGGIITGVEAWANYPGPDLGGDIQMNARLLHNEPEATVQLGSPNNYLSLVLVHELGHALGLKHPHDEPSLMPQALDSQHLSIMSYTHAPDTWPTVTWSYEPSTKIFSYQRDYILGWRTDWGVLDLAALMVMYGTNPAHHAGDTVHRLPPPSPQTWLYRTISDASGNDTLDLGALIRPSRIDLRPGTLSDVDVRTPRDWAQTLIDQGMAYYRQAGVLDARKSEWIERSVNGMIYEENILPRLWNGLGALGIADGTLIENLVLGPADDIVHDNAVDNTILTGAGDDTIFLGAGGWDRIDAGPGIDIAVLPSLSANITRLPGTGIVIAASASYGAILQNVEYLADRSGAWLAIEPALVGTPPRLPEWVDWSLHNPLG